MAEKPDCAVCERVMKSQGACEQCMPQLLPPNYIAAQVYALVQNQLITLGDVPIDLDIRTLLSVMTVYGIPHQSDIFHRVLLVARHMIERRNRETRDALARH